MGPHHSKEDSKKCREEMRQKVKEAKKRKEEAQKQEYQIKVIEVDKIEHSSAASLSDEDKRKVSIETG